MRKKKSFATLALLVAVLILGVGYAISSIDLKVNGDVTISPDDSNFNVEFTDATVDGTGNTATVGTGKVATLSVKSLKEVGNKVTATYTITNLSKAGINATLDSLAVTPADDAAKDYYKATAVFGSTNAIVPNGTETLTVTVELVKAPLEEVTGSFAVSFKANPVAAN